MHVDRDTVCAAAVHSPDTAAGRLQKLDQTRHHLVALLVVPETADSAESPGECPILAVNCDRVIVTAAEVRDLDAVQRRHVAILGPLDIQNDSLRHFLIVKCHLRIRDEVFAVSIVTQCAVLRTSERVQTTLEVQDHREIGAASYLHYRRSGILHFGGGRDAGVRLSDPALAQFIVASSEYYTTTR